MITTSGCIVWGDTPTVDPALRSPAAPAPSPITYPLIWAYAYASWRDARSALAQVEIAEQTDAPEGATRLDGQGDWATWHRIRNPRTLARMATWLVERDLPIPWGS